MWLLVAFPFGTGDVSWSPFIPFALVSARYSLAVVLLLNRRPASECGFDASTHSILSGLGSGVDEFTNAIALLASLNNLTGGAFLLWDILKKRSFKFSQNLSDFKIFKRLRIKCYENATKFEKFRRNFRVIKKI